VAEAARVYALQARYGVEMVNQAAEIKLRAERRCGELLQEMDKQHGARPPDTGLHDVTPPLLADLGIDKMQSSRWQRLADIPEPSFERYISEKKATGDLITTTGLLSHPDSSATRTSESFEWYTPTAYVESVRMVLGGIDLDPASSAAANEIIKAATYYSIEDDGLTHSWHGRLFLNPPYSGMAGPFTAKLIREYAAGNVTAAIALVSAHMTETEWFAPLWDFLLCFTDHRIPFWSPGVGPQTGPTHGSVFVYLGDQLESFAQQFTQHGVVVCRWKPEFLRLT
jgi:ParB family chromosome partitioning protein